MLKQYSRGNKDRENLTEGEMIEIMQSCIRDGMLVAFSEKYVFEQGEASKACKMAGALRAKIIILKRLKILIHI